MKTLTSWDLTVWQNAAHFPSKTMMFFQYGCLKDNRIDVVSQTGIAGRRNHSYESLLWLLLQEIHYPNLQHAFSTRDEKGLFAPVDGFHEATDTVLQSHGVVFGMDVQSVTEAELQKIQSMKKLLTSSIPKLFDEHNSLKMLVRIFRRRSPTCT